MRTTTRSHDIGVIALAGLAVTGLCLTRPALAQDDGYHVGEDHKAAAVPAQPPVSPVRHLARVEFLSGSASWRPNDAATWTRAENSRTLGEGAQFKVEEGGRAEIRFDDDSILRLGSNSVITLQTVFVDAQGQYTQIKMNSGVAMLAPREEQSVFEVNTPFLTVKTMGPSRLRIGVGDDVEVGVSRGRANLEGPQGKTTLNSGDFVTERADDKTYTVRALPSPDSWERWNEDRDRKLVDQEYPRHSPPSRSSLNVFLSLGFPVFGGRDYHRDHYYGRGAYRRRW